MARVQFLIRVESMINVGCTFGPDDFPARVWDELIAMALERSFVDRLVDSRRDKERALESEVDKARRATGIPSPGQTLFTTHSRPFK